MPEEQVEADLSCFALTHDSLDYKLRMGDAVDSEGQSIAFANYHPPNKDDGHAPGFVDKNFRLKRLRARAKEENSTPAPETDEGSDVRKSKPADTRAVVVNIFSWQAYSDRFIDINIAFIGGTAAQREEVARVANEWTVGTGVRFHFGVPSEGSDIRVAFDPTDGNWSQLGNMALTFETQPTLNLAEVNRHTILHEFGHVMGLGHEHSSPARGFGIKEQETLLWYRTTQGWDDQTIRVSVIEPYMGMTTNHSEYDPLSVMNYTIPSRLILAPPGVPIPPQVAPTVLSRIDQEWVRRRYPPPVLIQKPPLPPPRPNPPAPNWGNANPPNFIWNKPDTAPPAPVWNNPNPPPSIPTQPTWTIPPNSLPPTWTNPNPYPPPGTNPIPYSPNWSNPNPTWSNPQPIPQPQIPWTNPVTGPPITHPVTVPPQWPSHTRRILNTTTANWNLFPGSIPGTVKGEILWTDGNPNHTFPGRPTMRAYSVVRRQPPQDPNGVVIAQGLASQVNFQLLD